MTIDTAFKMIESALHGQALTACPLCGSHSEMWERAEDGTAAKAVCCSHGDPLACMPDDGIVSGGCPLYMPPEGFYRATYREAAKTWNAAAAEFVQMRAEAATPEQLQTEQSYADLCAELRQDREMLASVLRAVLKDPGDQEAISLAKTALGQATGVEQ